MVLTSLRRALTLAAGLVVTAALVTPAASAAPDNAPAAGGTWTGTGSLSVPRERAAGVLLNSGKALMMGGQFCDLTTCLYYSTAEQYDPVTGFWSSANAMSTARTDYHAVLLSNGKALAIGGTNGSGHLTADLYNSSSNTWSSGGSFSVPRDSGFQAVVMANGKVLVVGGCCVTPGPYSAAAEIYDPATNSWSAAASMSTARYGPVAVLLPTGKVLVAGGLNNSFTDLSSTELYDPTTNTWSPGGSMFDTRRDAEAVLVPSGNVLVTGGFNSNCLGTSEEYNPTTNSWGSYRTGQKPRSDQTATPVLINGGKLLVAGGNCSLKNSRLYDSTADTWSSGPDFNAGRRDHVMLRLRTGKVLAAGGDDFSTSLSSAELYTPVTAATAYATPNPVKKGSVVTIAGSGFLGGETVQLSYKGAVYASAVATGSGTFSVNFNTSGSAAKNYIDAAKGLTSGRTSYFQVLITTG